MLTDGVNFNKYFRCLSVIANDQWYATLCNVNMILIELWPKLHESCRELMFQFFREAVKLNVPKVSTALLSHIIGDCRLAVTALLLSSRFGFSINCLGFLGQDLLLVLMRLSKIPAINAIWVDLITTPSKFGLNDGEEFHELSSMHIFQFFRGPDGFSLRAETIRYVLYFFKTDMPSHVLEARSHFLYYLLTSFPPNVSSG
ncbi:unnamed protein product [Haemonchus placei]|uniref:SOSS complex subunit A homolog n=1 Tax=Haemonchus placei TaxID=6290 RepID=A0A3P7ZJ63_HAEPC|nr:unnamed protein product [Haemonchus placei]